MSLPHPLARTHTGRATSPDLSHELDPQKEEDGPATLRSAAVEALQSAARQNDPKEFDRLTRYALTLIERARAIGYRRQRDISERDGAMVPSEHPTQEQAGPALSHRLKARCIAVIQQLFS